MCELSRQRFDVVWGVCLSQMPWKRLEAAAKNTLEAHSRSSVAVPRLEFLPWKADWSIGILRPYSSPAAVESLKDLHQEGVGYWGADEMTVIKATYIFLSKNLWSCAIHSLPPPPFPETKRSSRDSSAAEPHQTVGVNVHRAQAERACGCASTNQYKPQKHYMRSVYITIMREKNNNK